MDWGSNDWVEPYTALYTQLNANPCFDRYTFDNGYAIYGVNLNVENQQKPQYGTCDLSIEFKKAPESNLIIMVFCYFDTQYKVDQKGLLHTGLEPKI